MFKIHTSLRFLTLTMALASGCADGPDPESGSEAPANPETAVELSLESLPLVAQVTFPNQGTLSFYEPEPGELLEVETGPTDPPRDRLVNEDHLTSAQKYEALTGQQAPARLAQLAAQERPEPEGPAVGAKPPAERSINKGFETMVGRDWFRANWCHQTDRYYYVLDYTRPSSKSADNVNYYKFGIYASVGPLPYTWFWKGYRFSGLLQTGWMADATIKYSFGGRYADSQAFPNPGNVFDHCVNYHY